MDSNKGPYTITFDASGDKISLNNSFNDSVNELKNELDLKLKKLEQIKNPTQYIFINESLNLDFGKAVAQASHAQEELFNVMINEEWRTKEQFDKYKQCINQNPRTIVVLGCKDSEEMYKIQEYFNSCDIQSVIYVDEKGDNYLLEPTAMAVEYLDKGDPRTNLIFENFHLYQPEVKEVRRTVERLKRILTHKSNRTKVNLLEDYLDELEYFGRNLQIDKKNFSD